MRIAIVYDRINTFGGAERVLLALNECFPDAHFYTLVMSAKNAEWSKKLNIHTTFLQKINFFQTRHRYLALIAPIAFETFNFDNYDVVISVSSAEAKNVITKPNTLHICYLLTPTRYLWSGKDDYEQNPGIGSLSKIAGKILKVFSKTLQNWDLIFANRPDYFVAISNTVKKRIEKYYKKNVYSIIYPPLGNVFFNKNKSKVMNNDYFLVVSRFVGYKKIDLIIKAFNINKKKLVIIGNGPQKDKLFKIKNSNISIITKHLTDYELGNYYHNCLALIVAANEDFGITACEAQASGKPVIYYKNSGIDEIVIDQKTGLSFSSQTVESINMTLDKFNDFKYTRSSIVANSYRFQTNIFKSKFIDLVNHLYNEKRRQII